MVRRVPFVFLTSLLAAATVWAETPQLPLGPHEHGVGQLNVVLEGKELRLELLGPAGNIVGFEHLPLTVKERMAVRRVAAQLAKAERQFALPNAAGCKLVAAEVDGEQMAAVGHDHQHDHGHAQPDHGGHGSHAHAEYHAVYRYSCRQPQALERIDVKLFGHYPTLTRLRWQALVPGGARAGELTPGAAMLSLR